MYIALTDYLLVYCSLTVKMGLTKQYLRYNPVAQFGVIASSRCNVVMLQMRNTKARYIAVAAVENVIIWDIRVGEKVGQILLWQCLFLCSYRILKSFIMFLSDIKSFFL